MSTTIDLIKTSVNVEENSTLPPSTFTMATISQNINFIGNFTVNDAALINEHVPTTSGFVLWQPSYGSLACYRFGVIPAGTLNAYNMTFISPLAVPYNARVSSDVITHSPAMSVLGQLQTTAAKARITAGYMKVTSGTAPIGTTALNGYFTASAITDVRSAFGLLGNYDAANLVQQACTAKDYVKEINLQDGVTAVVGPDVSSDMLPVDMYYQDFLQGSLLGTVSFTGIATSSAILAAGSAIILYQGWVTPWNINDTTPSPGLGVTTQTTVFPNAMQPVGGTFELTINYTVQSGHIAQNAGYLEQVLLRVQHYWATCSSDGAVYYSVCTDAFPSDSYSTYCTELPRCYTVNPKKYMTDGFINGGTGGVFEQGDVAYGMYIGSRIVISVQNISDVAGIANARGLDTTNVWASNCVSVKSVGDSSRGAVTPARVLRWDSVSNGQIIRVDGNLIAECVPGTTTAPFTQRQANMNSTCEYSDAMLLMRFLYNCDNTALRRVWNTASYDMFVRNVLPNWGKNDILASNNQRIINAAKSAGVFDNNSNTNENTLPSSGASVISGARSAGPFTGTVTGALYGQDRKRVRDPVTERALLEETVNEGSAAPHVSNNPSIQNLGSVIGLPNLAMMNPMNALRDLDRAMEPHERAMSRHIAMKERDMPL